MHFKSPLVLITFHSQNSLQLSYCTTLLQSQEVFMNESLTFFCKTFAVGEEKVILLCTDGPKYRIIRSFGTRKVPVGREWPGTIQV